MNCLICEKPGSLVISNSERPTPKKGESLLKIHRIGICGTDIHAFAGNQPYFTYPRVLGHELAAEYIEGDAEGFSPGDALTIIPYFNCGNCIACRQDKPNCCSNIKVFGVHIDGGMKEFIVVPNHYLLKGDGLTYDQLAFVEPLAIAGHGIRRANVQKGEMVLVMGAGPIGLGLVQMAKIAGAKVVILDVNDFRLEFAKENFGADHTINPLSVDITKEVSRFTNDDFVNVVIDATGNQKVINDGLQYLAHGGRYVLVGLQKGDLVFNHPEFHKRETTLLSSRNATIQDFEFVINCLRNGSVNANNFITHRLDFKTVPDQFEMISNPKNKVVKAIIDLN